MTSALGWARTLLADWPTLVVDLPPAGDADEVIADWAASGAVALTGRYDGPPQLPPGCAATAARGAELAFATLHDAAGVPTDWHLMLSERAASLGRGRRAPWSVGGSCQAVAAADGWVAVNLARPDDRHAVAAMVGERIEEHRVWSTLAAWASTTPAAEIVALATVFGLPCGAIGETSSAAIRSCELMPSEAAARPARPLVVDLSALWAGPLCSHLLGATGGEVVKVETTTRLDGARRGDAAFYSLLNAGHDSVLVDLDAAADRELLAELCERADIIVTASRPRAWASLGLDPEVICRRSPTTWVSITAYGLEHQDRVGFGDDVAMSAGLVAADLSDGRPIPVADAIADPLTGMHAAVAALASFRSGGSRVVDVSMHGVVASTLTGATSAAAVSSGPDGRWLLATDGGSYPVALPSARRGSAVSAAVAGRDTEGWRSRCDQGH